MKLALFNVGLRFVVFQAGLLLCQTASAVVNFTVTPSLVSNNYTGPITVQVTGLPSGDTVTVQRFLDANADGVVDGGDLLFQQFNLTDGQGGMVIGGVTNINVPGDTDTVAGQITAKLNFQTDFSDTIVGKYVFQLSSPAGHFTPITRTFTVTNFPYAQEFTGTVLSNAVGVPYAAVILFQSSGGNDLTPAGGAVADNSGNYTIQAPAGTYTMAAFKTNFVADSQAAANIVLGSGAIVMTNLSLIAATQYISGQIVDANNSSIGLPGLLFSTQSTNGLLGITFTDSNGIFNAGVIANQWKLGSDSAGVAILGYLDLQNKTKISTGGGSVSNVTVALPKATALFYGTVTDPVGDPFPGVAIYASDNGGMYQADGYADPGGNYVTAAVGGLGSNDSWEVSVDSPSLYPNDNFSQPSFGQNGGTNLAIGTAVLADFKSILATNHINGNVQFNGGPVSSVQVYAYSQDTNNYQAQAITDGSGDYSLTVGNGNWYVDVNCQGGNNSLDGILGGGNYQCPCGPNVIISNDNATANFTVSGGGMGSIYGYVTNTSGQPIIGVSVNASDCVGDYYSTMTTNTGFYTLNVPNGIWNVNVDCGALGLLGYQCVGEEPVTVSSNMVEQSFNVQLMGSGGGPPPGLGSPAKSGAHFQFLLNGTTGQSYTVQTSTNLNSTNWISLFVTNNTISNSFLIIDPNATNKQEFYRILVGQ